MECCFLLLSKAAISPIPPVPFSASMASQILVQQVLAAMEDTDGGLGKCLEISKVHRTLVEQLREEGVTSLSDLTGYFTTAKFEDEAAAFRDKVADLRDKNIEAARVRTAYRIAIQAMEASQGKVAGQPPVVNDVDIEAPLNDVEKESVATSWKRYNVSLTMYLDPCDPLVNRCFREFRANTPTLLGVEKSGASTWATSTSQSAGIISQEALPSRTQVRQTKSCETVYPTIGSCVSWQTPTREQGTTR